jgi:hypothetical protein
MATKYFDLNVELAVRVGRPAPSVAQRLPTRPPPGLEPHVHGIEIERLGTETFSTTIWCSELSPKSYS